jgi:hypothetical protein
MRLTENDKRRALKMSGDLSCRISEAIDAYFAEQKPEHGAFVSTTVALSVGHVVAANVTSLLPPTIDRMDALGAFLRLVETTAFNSYRVLTTKGMSQ